MNPSAIIDASTALQLSAAQLDLIESAAVRAYPNECCGILLGRDESTPPRRIIDRIISVPNDADPTEHHHRFTISPQQMMQAEQIARSAGLQILGIYHSHPDHPARPSGHDREQAWPFYSYVITATSDHGLCSTTAWLYDSTSNSFSQQSLEIMPNHSRVIAPERIIHAP